VWASFEGLGIYLLHTRLPFCSDCYQSDLNSYRCVFAASLARGRIHRRQTGSECWHHGTAVQFWEKTGGRRDLKVASSFVRSEGRGTGVLPH
jgi:hypothetical protein